MLPTPEQKVAVVPAAFYRPDGFACCDGFGWVVDVKVEFLC